MPGIDGDDATAVEDVGTTTEEDETKAGDEDAGITDEDVTIGDASGYVDVTTVDVDVTTGWPRNWRASTSTSSGISPRVSATPCASWPMASPSSGRWLFSLALPRFEWPLFDWLLRFIMKNLTLTVKHLRPASSCLHTIIIISHVHMGDYLTHLPHDRFTINFV